MSAPLTPLQIVRELDRHIVGQAEAKKAVSIALRTRWRRQQLSESLKEEITPKNIIMIGPTGVGKTEIARRLARLAQSPFVKVEASRYTEVGYVGRDVESMVRDLAEVSVAQVRAEERARVRKRAALCAEERLVDLVCRQAGAPHPRYSPAVGDQELKEKVREDLHAGAIEGEHVEVEVPDSRSPFLEIFGASGYEQIGMQLKDILSGPLGARTRQRRVTVKEAREILEEEEEGKLIDQDKIISEAIRRAENLGIIFVDEIDKIVGRQAGVGPDVSREGVQRDILPIVEGSTVHTKYGAVRTNHILFLAAGAFHAVKPSDMIPELQGRFPIRVELKSLGLEDFVRILSEPENALVKQYTALLATEGVRLEFTEEALRKVAEYAVAVNEGTENIGARRLYTLMEKLLEDVSFHAPEMPGQLCLIDAKEVERKLGGLVQDQDVSRYIL